MGVFMSTRISRALKNFANWRIKTASALAIIRLITCFALTSDFEYKTLVFVIVFLLFVQIAQSWKAQPLNCSYHLLTRRPLTLIGALINLLVDGVARAHGFFLFLIFEVNSQWACYLWLGESLSVPNSIVFVLDCVIVVDFMSARAIRAFLPNLWCLKCLTQTVVWSSVCNFTSAKGCGWSMLCIVTCRLAII